MAKESVSEERPVGADPRLSAIKGLVQAGYYQRATLRNEIADSILEHAQLFQRSVQREDERTMAYRILCVDDEKAILTLFERAFEKTDYTVYTAYNGVEALEKVRASHPDVVLLDVAMPHMGGDEALPLIHEIDPDIAVIIVSGKASEDEARDLLAMGAFDFLQKPIRPKHLLDLVEHWRVGRELGRS